MGGVGGVWVPEEARYPSSNSAVDLQRVDPGFLFKITFFNIVRFLNILIVFSENNSWILTGNKRMWGTDIYEVCNWVQLD